MSNRSLMFGGLLAFGTFQSSYTAAGFVFVLWAIKIMIGSRQFPDKRILVLSFAMAATAIATPNPFMPMAIALIFLSVAVIAKEVRSSWNVNSFAVGLFLGVSTQMIAVVTTWGEPRPPLFSLNASQVAQSGLMFWLILPELKRSHQWGGFIAATLHIGVSMARLPLFVAVAFFIVRPNIHRAAMLVLLVLFFVVTGVRQGTIDRLTFGPLSDAVSIRAGLINDPAVTSAEIMPTQSALPGPALPYPVASWTGYGVGNYVTSTGLVRPHNVFVLMFYEMGAFVIVPVFLLGWAVFRMHIPFSVFFALFLLWQGTEEAAGRIEGMFTTAAVLTAVWRSQPPRANLLTATRERLRFGKPARQ